MHDPCFSNSHVIVTYGQAEGEPADVIIKPGVWLLGGYVHLFTGNLRHGDEEPLSLRTTVETERPEWRPMSETIFSGLPAVTVVDFTGDGDVMASGSADGEVKLFDTVTGDPLGKRRVDEPGCPVTDLDFSPDGRQLVTVGDNGVVKVWSVPALEQVAEYRNGEIGYYWAEFAPDGPRLAAASDDGRLRVWNRETGKLETDLSWAEEIGARPLFAFGDDSRYLLFGSGREDGIGTIGAVDLDRKRVSTVMQVGLSPVTVFARSPRGELLAAGDAGGRVLVWALRPGLLASSK